MTIPTGTPSTTYTPTYSPFASNASNLAATAPSEAHATTSATTSATAPPTAPPTATAVPDTYNDYINQAFATHDNLVVIPSDNVLLDSTNVASNGTPYSAANNAPYSAPYGATHGTPTTMHHQYQQKPPLNRPGAHTFANSNCNNNNNVTAATVITDQPHSTSDVRFFRGRPVKAKNNHLPDNVLAFKERRKARTIVSAWTGGTIGFFTFGPIGAFVGASTAYTAAKAVGKRRERRMALQQTAVATEYHGA